MYVLSLACAECGATYQLDRTIYTCPRCQGLFEVTYDYVSMAESVKKDALATRKNRTIWRYREFLPLNPKDAISLGEGNTPLIPAKKLGHIVDLNHLFLKLDFLCPTGSFKDRGSSLMVSKARHLNLKTLVIDSSGNAAASIAAYSAKASLHCYVFSPAYASASKLIQSLAYGATVFAVEGTRLDTYKTAKTVYEHFSWYYCGFQTNPYAIEGLKTVAFEICEQSKWTPPDYIVFPVGTGSNLLGCWKGLVELDRLGWIPEVSSLACIQPEGCAPIAHAFQEKSLTIQAISHPKTIAEGLMISRPLKGEQVLQSLSASKGTAEIVSDSEIRAAAKLLAQVEGIFIEPSSATALAGVIKLRSKGLLSRDEQIVCVLTGTGLKTRDAFAESVGKPILISPGVEAVKSFMTQH